MEETVEVETKTHWKEYVSPGFFAKDRSTTTILHGGSTILQDEFIGAALRSLGYKAEPLPCPDNDSMKIGKEYGNRGQCNPTYFTVGNLVKYLIKLRDEQGMSSEEIIKNYAFMTPTGCGPCRFSMYTTEYKKALSSAGFSGLRLITFDRTASFSGGDSEEAGFQLSPKLFFALAKAVLCGDVLNLVGYRIRPYEMEKGETDRVLAECKSLVLDSLATQKSTLKTLWKCRKLLSHIKVDKSVVKPKVAIVGEFWARTTEGDGSYDIYKYLEGEGAECKVTPLSTTVVRMYLDKVEKDSISRLGKERFRDRIQNYMSDFGVKMKVFIIEKVFELFAHTVGLKGEKLMDVRHLKKITKPYYHKEIFGGEGFLEVGELISASEHKEAHLVLSLKPFGCMPSSGISDGVQSLVQNKYPGALFLPIETSGDGAANVYSRVQMSLFKAKQMAQNEHEEIIARQGERKIARRLKKAALKNPLSHPKHRVACTATNFLY